MIKFCKKCYEDKNERCQSGYSYWWKDDVSVCPNDQADLINIDFPTSDLSTLIDISESKSFIDAMINLYQTDIIEYQLKMSQFRQQLNQKKADTNKVSCPYCRSTDVKKISMTSKVTHGAVFGLFGARKILKQWHCNKCKSDF